MKKIFTNKPLFTGLMVSAFWLATVSAHGATTVLNEDFNDVTGMSFLSTVRPVSSVLSDAPNPLPGALWSASSGTNDNVGIRRTDNNINVNVSNSFSSYFPVSSTNKFLVLGDQVGPNTGTANSGIFAFALPFTLPNGAASLSVSFDWAFAGDDTSTAAGVQDLFTAGIAGSGFSISSPMSPTTTLLTQTSPNTTGFTGFNSNGQFNATIAFGSLPPVAAGNLRYLVFGLSEHSNTATNSALGIDNIKVSAVPVPAAVWLFGSAILGLVGVGRRKKSVNHLAC